MERKYKYVTERENLLLQYEEFLLLKITFTQTICSVLRGI